MPARRRSRQKALQILFFADSAKVPVDDAIRSFYEALLLAEAEEEGSEDKVLPPAMPDPFMESLARGSVAQRDELDAWIAKRAEHWRLERMPIVDRNILRMAIYEMKDEGTPPAVVIDEALELARRYSEEEAVPFINGVLDAIRRLLFEPAKAEPSA